MIDINKLGTFGTLILQNFALLESLRLIVVRLFDIIKVALLS